MSDDIAQPMQVSSGNPATAQRIGWYVHDAKTLRIKASLTINKLASLADVSRDSISNIETLKPVTELVAAKVFNALNRELNNGLIQEDYVKSTPPKPKK